MPRFDDMVDTEAIGEIQDEGDQDEVVLDFDDVFQDAADRGEFEIPLGDADDDSVMDLGPDLFEFDNESQFALDSGDFEGVGELGDDFSRF